MITTMKKVIILFLFLLLSAQANDSINQRQDSMKKLKELVQSSNALLKEKKFNSQLAKIYQEIGILLDEFPDLFPKDSLISPSRAKPTILEDPLYFKQLAQEASRNASMAKSAIINKDMSLFFNSNQKLLDQCNTCHSRYRN